MLDEKDKLILEYLMNDCRITTTKLAKLTKLSQPSIVYRIKKLEDENYILKYDALIDFDKMPIPMYQFYIRIPNDFKKEFENWCIQNKNIMSLIKFISKYNYGITSLLNDKELLNLEKYLKKNNIAYEKHKVHKNIYMPFSIYNLLPPAQLNLKTTPGYKLDDTDIRIIEYLVDSGAKDSVKQIAQKTKLSVELITYRLKKLKKYQYFRLFLAQPNPEKFHITYSALYIKTKNITTEELANKIHSINKTSILGEMDNNTYFATTIMTDIKDYKQTLNQIYEILGDNLLELNDMMINGWVFINRLNLKDML